ncbi:MAG TPA: methyltransferase domain-containing protein [Methylomirabilota bacterium]|nr:methyltransferase domain-containing protein [Methylomirabilota bacterium]
MTTAAAPGIAPQGTPSTTMPCPACRGDMVRALSEHPGYRDDGQVFGVFRCPACGSSAAWPRTVPGDLYDVIYAQAARIPGYSRYEEYATLVSRSGDPLRELADREDVYWGIAAALQEMGGPGGVGRVLDIGCGLGYLTFALSRVGYDVRGLDVSKQAIAVARARFGDLFSVGTAAEFKAASHETWSVAILAEVLEHVPDPGALLAEVWSLVAPGGALIVTTPNRTALAAAVIWDTDPPPVHLTWFTEEGVRRLGGSLGAVTTFTDFTGYSATHPTWRLRVPAGRVTRGPMIAADGSPLQDPSTLEGTRRALSGLPGGPALVALLQSLRGRLRVRGSRRDTMVAILRRPS